MTFSEITTKNCGQSVDQLISNIATDKFFTRLEIILNILSRDFVWLEKYSNKITFNKILQENVKPHLIDEIQNYDVFRLSHYPLISMNNLMLDLIMHLGYYIVSCEGWVIASTADDLKKYINPILYEDIQFTYDMKDGEYFTHT